MQAVYVTVLLSLAACAVATVEVESLLGYHKRVAIPMATEIRAAEAEILANQNRFGRIVGGIVSQPNAHPYMGGLVITYVEITAVGVCGSVLISNNRLLTAAHCWFDGELQALRFVVVVGSEFLFSGGHRVATSLVKTYPGWDPAINRQNNLAIIALHNPLTLSDSIRPIALATDPTESFAGAWAVITGFGRTSDQQTSIPVLSVLHEVEVPVITVQQCFSVFGDIAQPNTICTDGSGGVGACRGDGGGPLVVNRDGQALLVGVNTFGAAAGCQLGFPSGFSRITSFLDFIAEHL